MKLCNKDIGNELHIFSLHDNCEISHINGHDIWTKLRMGGYLKLHTDVHGLVQELRKADSKMYYEDKPHNILTP